MGAVLGYPHWSFSHAVLPGCRGFGVCSALLTLGWHPAAAPWGAVLQMLPACSWGGHPTACWPSPGSGPSHVWVPFHFARGRAELPAAPQAVPPAGKDRATPAQVPCTRLRHPRPGQERGPCCWKCSIPGKKFQMDTEAFYFIFY